MIFGLEKNNEEGSGEWVLFLGFSKQELEFHMDFKSTSALQAHGTRVFKTQVVTMNSSLKISKC